MVELGTLLPKHPGEERVNAMLEAALTGTTYNDESGESKDDSGMKFTSSKDKEVAADTVFETETETETDTDDFDDEAKSILADIRARKSNK